MSRARPLPSSAGSAPPCGDSDAFDAARLCVKSCRNHCSENRYIGSTFDRLVHVKNSRAERSHTRWNFRFARSQNPRIRSTSLWLADTSSATFLAVSSEATASSSSSRLPSRERSSRMSSSIFWSSALLRAPTRTLRLRFSSRSRSSCCTTAPISWSWRPSLVSVKATSVTRDAIAGLKFGFGARVARNNRLRRASGTARVQFAWIFTSWSPITTRAFSRGVCRVVLDRRLYRIGSNSESIPSSRTGQPDRTATTSDLRYPSCPGLRSCKFAAL
eukprot:gene6798-biopygen6763